MSQAQAVYLLDTSQSEHHVEHFRKGRGLKGRPSPLNLSNVPHIDMSIDDSPEHKKVEGRDQTPGGQTGQTGAARRRPLSS
eukprot:2105638-Pyramimonas_sp.AAC.1